jgi:hypothetical protein
MPKITNNFLKGKMNKDLDERIVPKGEYREAQNILITQSEGSDVGAIENILGNALSRADFSPSLSNQGIETIGHYADVLNKRIFWFVTNFTGDTNDIRTMSRASATDICMVLMIDLDNDDSNITTLVSGNFLNFSKNHLITGVNLIDDLLFWTDNYNQPRKINVTKAIADQYHYTKEEQISVAKVAPYLAPILYNENAEAEIDNVPLTNDEDVFSDYLKDKFVRFSYRYKYEDGEYTTMAPFTQIVFKPLNEGIIESVLTTDINKTDNQDIYSKTIVDIMKNHYNKIEVRIPLPTNENQTDIDALWENEFRIIKLEILIKESDQDVVKVIKEIDVTDSDGNLLESFSDLIDSYSLKPNNNTYYRKAFKFVYKSEEPYKILEDKQITRVYDQVPIRAKAQEISGNRIIYGNFTENYSLPKDEKGKTGINYVIRVDKKGKHEYIRSSNDQFSSNGNYVRFQNLEKIYTHSSIKQRRNYQIGVVLADIFGRQSPVILGTDSFSIPIEESMGDFIDLGDNANRTDTIRVDADVDNYSESFNGEYSWSSLEKTIGKSLKIVFGNDNVIDPNTVYNGDINSPKYNPYGWYSYKIVVKQQEQEYYNIYTNHPADHWNNDTNNHDDVLGYTWISLYGDNINKVPKDVSETGDVRESVAGSDVKLFPKVVKSSEEGENLSVMGIDQDPIEVMTVGNARSQGVLTEGFRDKDRVHDFVMAKRNPLLAQVKSLNNSENNRVQFRLKLQIAEANYNYLESDDPEPNLGQWDTSYILIGDGNIINPFIRKGMQLVSTTTYEGNYNTLIGKRAAVFRAINDEQDDGDVTNYGGGGWDSKTVIAKFSGDSSKSGPVRVGQFVEYQKNPGGGSANNAYYGIGQNDAADGIYDFMFSTYQSVEHGDHTTKRYPVLQEVTSTQDDKRLLLTFDRRVFPPGIEDRQDFQVSSRQALALYDPIIIENVETKTRVVNGVTKYYQRLKLSHELPVVAFNDFTTEPGGTIPPGIEITSELILQNVEDSPTSVSTVLTVLETDPIKSNLDVFYESSTSGLIKDLNEYNPGAFEVFDVPIAQLKELEIAYFNTFILAGGGDGQINKPGQFHIEESRIKGEFNGKSTDYGVRAHLVDDEYAQRIRSNALIYSGIFNAKTKLNNTNQFSIGESITKAVDVTNGSIQKLYAEDTNLIIFQENKVSKALIDKDAIFTAEGQPLTTASKVVIGQVSSFAGKYGISKNPESFAVYGGRKYFSDKNRGLILRLSQDGITPISDAGMRSFFRDNLYISNRIYGMYDEQKNKYVVSLQSLKAAMGRVNKYGQSTTETASKNDLYTTLSFDEASGGWVSFYTYKPTFGFSISNKFYTFYKYLLYEHYREDVQRCKFYTSTYTDPAEIEFVLNDQPNIVKNFLTIDYEGSSGWKMDSAETDTHTAYPVLTSDTNVSALSIPVNFLNKENRYYSHLRNNTTSILEGQVIGVDLSGTKGYYNKIIMQYWKPSEAAASSVNKAELFAVGNEVVLSSQ